MSILDALKTFKQERESIDDVAALPQALIMQMAQKGQIPKTDVPMILARKAEIAQTQAQMNALRQQQAGGVPPTLMERMIASNAQQEAPTEMTDVGIASNPVPEMRMAGGGIIAFERGGDVPGMTDEERAEYIKNNPYLQRSQAIANIPAGFTDFIKEYNPITGSKFREGVAGFFNESPESQATRFRAASNRTVQAANPTREVPAIPTASQRQETADKNDAMASVGQSSKIDYKKADEILKASRKDNQRTTPAEAPTPNQPTAVTPKEKLFADYEKMFMDEREAAKGAREEAKWSRLMEAGLNIMGGESPYAFSNVGKGAAAAARGYAEDVKGLRAEERDRVKQLASLGAKREELGLKEREVGAMEKYRSDWARLEGSKIDALRQQNIDAKISADVEKNFATLMNFYKADIDKGDINPSDLYQQAQRNVGSTRGKDIGSAGNLPTANTFSWNQLGKKPTR
jgi:hypothetical protein